MFTFKVGEEKYKIQYKYRTLLGTNIIDKVVGIGEMVGEKKPAEMFKGIIGTTAEMLLIGLQANHSDKFGYDNEEEYNERILEMLDLMDEYDAENMDENGDFENSGFSLFTGLQSELERNGFLSAMTKGIKMAASEQNATVIPMDHKAKQKDKPGAKK